MLVLALMAEPALASGVMSPVIKACVRFRVVAAIVAAAAQLALCSASFAEARFGADARAHVETSGTRIHHAHDEATCAACSGRHLLASSELETPRSASFSRSIPGLRVDYELVTRTAHRFDARSRAPPAFLA
jgi:hypothetical protein